MYMTGSHEFAALLQPGFLYDGLRSGYIARRCYYFVSASVPAGTAAVMAKGVYDNRKKWQNEGRLKGQTAFMAKG